MAAVTYSRNDYTVRNAFLESLLSNAPLLNTNTKCNFETKTKLTRSIEKIFHGEAQVMLHVSDIWFNFNIEKFKCYNILANIFCYNAI